MTHGACSCGMHWISDPWRLRANLDDQIFVTCAYVRFINASFEGHVGEPITDGGWQYAGSRRESGEWSHKFKNYADGRITSIPASSGFDARREVLA